MFVQILIILSSIPFQGLASADLQNGRSKTSLSFEQASDDLSKASLGTNRADGEAASKLGQPRIILENLTGE